MENLVRDMQKVLNFPEEMELHPPARTFVRNTKAMCKTSVNIFEYPEMYTFTLDMPGLDAANIKVEDGILQVSGKIKKKKPSEIEKEGGRPIRIDRKRARYMRKFRQPPNADSCQVKATYRDNVLEIEVLKKHPVEEPPKPKTVKTTFESCKNHVFFYCPSTK